MKIFSIIIAVILVICLCMVVYSLVKLNTINIKNKDVATEIETVVAENMRAVSAEDLDATLNTMHTQAPNYLSTKQTMSSLFETFDVIYDMLSFSYIGQNGEYAFARISQSTRKVSGPAFQNNNIDAIHIFRKENGEWKFWQSAILEIKYTD